MTGSILRGIGSFYTVLCDEDGREYTLRAQKKLRHQKMTPMVGDHVRFTPGQGEEDGWLEEILPRRSMMERPSVANVDMLMLVIASVPQPDMLLCDKLILRAEKGGMIPAICVNKIDLGGDLAEQIRREYVGTQLRVFSVSAHEGTGIPELREAMRGKVTCLAGQSAVGKSSLLNALFDLGLETGGLSRKTERGRHTTRRAEMMAVDGMFVLDTPGIQPCWNWKTAFRRRILPSCIPNTTRWRDRAAFSRACMTANRLRRTRRRGRGRAGRGAVDAIQRAADAGS